MRAPERRPERAAGLDAPVARAHRLPLLALPFPRAAGLLISSFGLYALALAITVCCFVFYTSAEHETCGLSKFFVAFNLILCILVTALSVHPRVQEGVVEEGGLKWRRPGRAALASDTVRAPRLSAMPSSGILQSGVVSFYTTYLTWSAVANISGTAGTTQTTRGKAKERTKAQIFLPQPPAAISPSAPFPPTTHQARARRA